LVEELRPLAMERKIKLEFISQKPEFWVNADGQKLKQVVQNLVDNAIKYTPSGFVAVKLEDRESKALLSVKDTGLGIASALLPQLFEEFVRDERVKKEIRGTGLGLYIARKIVEAHSGRIWAESGGEGKGSTFYLELAQVK
ncbi:MAG: HAMP domain-containing sensor histidine kinase, partial [Patescibacteria group bacterium]